jgi:hypothetical protein
VAGPKHALDEVKMLASKWTMRLSVSKAREPLVKCFGTTIAARSFARDIIMSLAENAYAETIEQRFGLLLDVYGVRAHEILWYIKLAIEVDSDGDDLLLVVSFHPAEKSIRTKGGELKP